jgi:6-pyruvoyltetrahydropterin/6-carboxytetrahydropterin synthase
MQVFIEDSFDSAHFLPMVPVGHKCHRTHGHTYRIRLFVEGEVAEETGWVIDYAEIKSIWDVIKSMLDHRLLNEIDGLRNPTCENIAEWIGKRMAFVTSIEPRETLNCGVVWTQ